MKPSYSNLLFHGAAQSNRTHQHRLMVETLESRQLLAQLSVTGATVNESSGEIGFAVELSEAPTTPVKAYFNTLDGTAIGGIDYESVNNRELTFQPGETDKTVTVELLDNLLRDGNENSPPSHP